MKNDIFELRDYANMLSNGIDPTSGLKFQEDTILNNPKILKYNKRVRELIDRFVIILDTGKKQTNEKIDFFLTKEMENRIALSEKPIIISELCYRINRVVPVGMKKMKASQITNQLVELGALKVVECDNNQGVKMPTESGIEIGIVSELKTTESGKKYYIIKYSITAQRFILEKVLSRFDW